MSTNKVVWDDARRQRYREMAVLKGLGISIHPKTVWNKGKKMDCEYKERCRKNSTGRKANFETKIKMGLAQKKIGNRPPIMWGNKFRLGKPTSQLQKEITGKRAKGQKYALGNILSPETKKKMSKAKLGIKKTLETKLKMSIAQKGKPKFNLRGEKHPRWISDRNLLKRYKGSEEKRSPAYKSWRNEILRRDNYKCRIADNNCGGRLEVHHILPWRDFVELRYKINNGITLCHAHHPRGRAEEKRLIPAFQELVSVSRK